jgi:transposase-like protein
VLQRTPASALDLRLPVREAGQQRVEIVREALLSRQRIGPRLHAVHVISADEATSLETIIRRRPRGLIDAIVEEELDAALGAAESARVGAARQGYRHGTHERTLTASLGPTTFAMPRARLRTAAGPMVEWRSLLVPRYQRRSERVDEAILGVYLSGTNTRRIKGALAPLLHGGPLSKDAASRLVGRLADDFETWRRRDLAEDQIQYLLMDSWYPKVRIGKRRVRVPVTGDARRACRRPVRGARRPAGRR